MESLREELALAEVELASERSSIGDAGAPGRTRRMSRMHLSDAFAASSSHACVPACMCTHQHTRAGAHALPQLTPTPCNLTRLAFAAAWQLARQATEVDELTAAVDKAAAAAAAAGSSSAGGRDISDVDAELAVLEGQQRQVEGTRDELLRRQGRIKVRRRCAGVATFDDVWRSTACVACRTKQRGTCLC